MPPEEIQIIEDFLTFIENARATLPTADPFWANLQSFRTQLETVEDRPLKLALFIQSWCREFQVTIDPATMHQLRVSVLKKGQEIPTPTAGQKASKVYNKAVITESINNALPKQST
ncbi:hypothetical protein [Spirulina subsalsa]|uniref:hypothetical protein n=1 Tax=Spirulina subsalsa TaxID=54311 RepID=UPI00030C8F49|nr:hypothetical protein [Spirulina subsalsa]